jgi:hypothetical protein
VVDTSYLYQVENEPHSSASLRDLARAILNKKLETFHDSIEDSQISLDLAEYIRVNGPQPPISRSPPVDNTTLLIHRIPKACTEDTIKEMFTLLTFVVPVSVTSVQHPAQYGPTDTPSGRTCASFSSSAHATLAFDTLPGPDRPDKNKRSQKRVYLKSGGYICVRK